MKTRLFFRHFEAGKDVQQKRQKNENSVRGQPAAQAKTKTWKENDNVAHNPCSGCVKEIIEIWCKVKIGLLKQKWGVCTEISYDNRVIKYCRQG